MRGGDHSELSPQWHHRECFPWPSPFGLPQEEGWGVGGAWGQLWWGRCGLTPKALSNVENFLLPSVPQWRLQFPCGSLASRQGHPES